MTVSNAAAKLWYVEYLRLLVATAAKQLVFFVRINAGTCQS